MATWFNANFNDVTVQRVYFGMNRESGN